MTVELDIADTSPELEQAILAYMKNPSIQRLRSRTNLFNWKARRKAAQMENHNVH